MWNLPGAILNQTLFPIFSLLLGEKQLHQAREVPKLAGLPKCNTSTQLQHVLRYRLQNQQVTQDPQGIV